MYARSKNPLLHPDLLFHMSSLGRQQARYLATMHARSKQAVEERAHQLLHDKGEEKCLRQGHADCSEGLIKGFKDCLKPYHI
jgi:hypothetical protein